MEKHEAAIWPETELRLVEARTHAEWRLRPETCGECFGKKICQRSAAYREACLYLVSILHLASLRKEGFFCRLVNIALKGTLCPFRKVGFPRKCVTEIRIKQLQSRVDGLHHRRCCVSLPSKSYLLSLNLVHSGEKGLPSPSPPSLGPTH